jgi:hypothetical protein
MQSAGFISCQAQVRNGLLAACNLGIIATQWTEPTRWTLLAAVFTSSWQA